MFQVEELSGGMHSFVCSVFGGKQEVVCFFLILMIKRDSLLDELLYHTGARPLSSSITQGLFLISRSVTVILSRKPFEAIMNIGSAGAQRAVPSHSSASESSTSHSSPRASIQQHQRGPTTGDYHTTGSPAPNHTERDQSANKWAQ